VRCVKIIEENPNKYRNIIAKYVEEKQLLYNKRFNDENKKIKVKIMKEKPFFMAEEYHQEYAIKNPKLMEKELIESGRTNKK